jgi:hypothetical protein
MLLTDTYFNTNPILIKRQGRKILGLYPAEKLARKMTKASHVLRVPRPGLSIDAETYNLHLADKDDWHIIFEIDDGRRFWITVPEFNQRKHYIDRGQGKQVVIDLIDLHRDDDDGSSCVSLKDATPAPVKSSKSQQLSLFGGEA